MHKTRRFDKAVQVVFHLICLVATIGLISDCLMKYLDDEDATRVEYPRFYENDKAGYPSVTYCIGYPILWGPIWNKYGKGDRAEIRQDFIKYIYGDKVDIKFSDSDYDKVTVKLEDNLSSLKYFPSIEAELLNNVRITWSLKNGTTDFELKRAFKRFKNQNSIWIDKIKIEEDLGPDEKSKILTPKLYISHRGINKKCYTFDVPDIRNEKFKFFKLYIDPKIFPKFGAKTNYTIKAKKYQTQDLHGVSKFSIYFHYPNQNLKALSSKTGFIPAINESKYYSRQYFLSGVEVLRRRKKTGLPCVAGKYDEEIMKSLIDEFGCKPPTIQPGMNASACNRTQNTKFQNVLMNGNHPPPCGMIHSMSIRDGEQDQKWWGNKVGHSESKMMIDINFEDEDYKETRYVKDYTGITLVGNTGGYIGKRFLKINKIVLS